MNRNKKLKCGQVITRSIVVLGLSAGVVGTAHSQTKNADGMVDAPNEGSSAKRDPFWPVGYVPEKSIQVESGQKITSPAVSTDWNGAMKLVAINGVSSRADDEFFAVINGQVKRVGETVTLKHEGTIYTWSVDSITPPGSVKLRRVSAK